MIRRILGVLFVIAIVITAIVFISNQLEKAKKVPPTIALAPYQVITEGRVLYAKEAFKQGASTIIKDYWATRKGGWVFQKGELILSPEFGAVRIVIRQK